MKYLQTEPDSSSSADPGPKKKTSNDSSRLSPSKLLERADIAIFSPSSSSSLIFSSAFSREREKGSSNHHGIRVPIMIPGIFVLRLNISQDALSCLYLPRYIATAMSQWVGNAQGADGDGHIKRQSPLATKRPLRARESRRTEQHGRWSRSLGHHVLRRLLAPECCLRL